MTLQQQLRLGHYCSVHTTRAAVYATLSAACCMLATASMIACLRDSIANEGAAALHCN